MEALKSITKDSEFQFIEFKEGQHKHHANAARLLSAANVSRSSISSASADVLPLAPINIKGRLKRRLPIMTHTLSRRLKNDYST